MRLLICSILKYKLNVKIDKVIDKVRRLSNKQMSGGYRCQLRWGRTARCAEWYHRTPDLIRFATTAATGKCATTQPLTSRRCDKQGASQIRPGKPPYLHLNMQTGNGIGITINIRINYITSILLGKKDSFKLPNVNICSL